MTSKDSPETRTQESEKDQEHSKQDENQGQSHRLSSPKSLSSESQSEQKEETTPVESDSSVSFASQWQAIWSPQYNMYYFYNLVTHETTWANPLQSEAGSSSVAAPANQIAPFGAGNTEEDAGTISSAGPTDSAATSQYAALQAAAIAQGIDPLLAHLDPSLRASMQGPSSVPGEVPTFTAQFNAHTGKFAASSSRTPGHLSEYERMKRMSEFYFDVNKWEEDLAREHEQSEETSGKKRKRPTKKDLERFKEQKRLKKIAKTAWLRT